MKKSRISLVLLALFTSILIASPANATTIKKYVTPSVPKPSAKVQEQITKYKQGNYLGAMIELEGIVNNSPNDDLAKYYLALSYTQLGKKEDAKKLYEELAQKDTNEVIKLYSRHAAECLDNPDNEACKAPIGSKKENEENVEEPQENNEQGEKKVSKYADIEEFIKSGKKIHPAAMDQITRERMERKIQEDEYKRMQQQTDGIKTDVQSYNQVPTNEEIAYALDVFSRLGINPFSGMNGAAYLSNNNMYPYSNTPDLANIFMLNQPNQQYDMFNILNNDFNYGI